VSVFIAMPVSISGRSADSGLGHAQRAADLPRQSIGDLDMTRDGLNVARSGIAPQLVLASLSFQEAAVPAEMPEQEFLLH
jgi:hypothetical protein